jgi:hypothetical protein
LRVYFGALLVALFGTGALLVYASTLADQHIGHGRSHLRSLGVDLMAISVIAAALAVALKRYLAGDD